MKTFARILFLTLCIATAVRAEIPVGWNTNYASAFDGVEKGKKPVLVFFTASWCGPCKLMSRLTLTNDAVKETLSTLAHVAIDIDEHQELASKHSINAVPTFVLLSATGDEVRRTTGFQPAEDFLRWLTNGISASQEAAARQAAYEQKIAEIDDQLAATNANAPRVAAQLFDLCGDRDGMIVKLTADRLKTLASRTPAALLEGLNDPRLPTRICVANILRARLGDTFDVDPWSEPSDRVKAVQRWRARLSESSNSNGP